jgi:hypothetical protein
MTDDQAMLRKILGGGPVTPGRDILCRYCWRPIFERKATSDYTWDLVHEEYEHSTCCDARGDGSVFPSYHPHEPAPSLMISVDQLIQLAALTVSEPTHFIRDTDESYDLGMIRLITQAAGLTVKDEDYVMSAVINQARKTRGPKFAKAAFRVYGDEPPANWVDGRPAMPSRRKERRNPPAKVTDTADAEKRMQAWALDQRPGHDFSEPGELLCRICGGGPDGIQHDERKYPR